MIVPVLVACGNNRQNLEKAEYLLARGGGENGRKAAEILEPLLESGDLFTKMRAHRYYGGAKINSAGLDGARFLSYLAHGDSNGNTVSLLKNIFGHVPVYSGGAALEDPTLAQMGEAAEEYLVEGISAISELRGTSAYQAVDTSTAAKCNENKKLCREKESVEAVFANLYFMRALNIAIRLSGLAEGFSSDSCTAYFTSNPIYVDRFAGALVQSRQAYARAGLDDNFYEGPNGNTDSQNARPNGFIEDIQTEVDEDRDGEIPGTDAEKAGVLCGYVETQD